MFFQRMFHLATPEKKPTATTFFHNRYLACEMPIQSLQVVVMVLENGMPPSMLGTKRKLRKDALIRRLTPYWKMEAANIVLVPTVAALLVVKMSEAISIALMLAMAATAFLLLVIHPDAAQSRMVSTASYRFRLHRYFSNVQISRLSEFIGYVT